MDLGLIYYQKKLLWEKSFWQDFFVNMKNDEILIEILKGLKSSQTNTIIVLLPSSVGSHLEGGGSSPF